MKTKQLHTKATNLKELEEEVYLLYNNKEDSNIPTHLRMTELSGDTSFLQKEFRNFFNNPNSPLTTRFLTQYIPEGSIVGQGYLPNIGNIKISANFAEKE